MAPLMHVIPRLLILYGSETGNAQDVAEFIQQRALNRHFVDTQSLAMDEFPVADMLPQCSTVVFVVSTTGDGEAPENMRMSWRFLLRKTLGSQWLANVHIAVFGLGDSSYAKYNAVARRLQARLVQLGAIEIIERGLGDDQHVYGYFGVLTPWLERLWTALLRLYRMPENMVVDDSPKPMQPHYSIIEHGRECSEMQEIACLTPKMDQSNFYDPPRTTIGREKGIIWASLMVNERITAENWEQDVRHLEFQVTDDLRSNDEAISSFRAGDVAVMYPENVIGVDDMLQYVKMDGDTVISINAADGSKQFDFPSPTTIRDLFTKYLAILETPRRSFFEKLSLYAVNEEEKEKLEELASAEGVDLLYDYCIREKKTYAEVLIDFPSVNVPLTILMQLIPRQQPRSYSISSSSLLHPGRVHLTVAIVDFLTPYKRRRLGICSSFFKSLDPSIEKKRVPMWIKRGVFTPPSLKHDLLLIGPGTGLASMRAVIQERHVLRKEGHDDCIGATYLYFGCRHENKDFLYRDELRGFVLTGDLTELHTAFSRDQDHKIYVQTRLAEQKETIFDFLMKSNGCIYIAGSAKRMPTDVYEVLRDILRSVGKMSLGDAEKIMKTLVRNKRYVVEAWSLKMNDANILELEQHVRTFVKLTNLTQTLQLHEWNIESLQRALEWSCLAEDVANINDTQFDVEKHIRQWFPVATLPTLPLDSVLTIESLRLARFHLLRSILQSPFLASHPTRSELVVAVLQELQNRREDALYPSTDDIEEDSPHSALLTEAIVGPKRTNALLAIARKLSDSCKRVRVQVLSGWVEILPLKSYALLPRTLYLKSMAKTLQRNAVDARAAISPKTYQCFLEDLRDCFKAPDGNDVREVVVLMLVMCDWPKEEPVQLEGMVTDLVNIVSQWVTEKPIRFWTFHPYLAAMLASKTEDLVRAYVSELFTTGLLQPWEREFVDRIATLVLQPKGVENILKPALSKLDPHLQQVYFNVDLMQHSS
ncbi:nadph-dependent diflavin [Plasmopara halstedii]|uniref:Nadph-dependent diflavin n=1 Tax=Plasmopara halstedii TaxID=4781 RepID=A0A0P1APL1_PLAHL|nr:nadph-dependent diflavin [Plasmopara halstedii]CEG43058.1 nadph-dependent diflavin [Plasmopara halstedii]|eukprot:XP_024579427.1 nadph-dependent diflavin [Plasmopara halstedii]